MNLQQRKKQFVMDFLSVSNEQVINKLENLLKEEKSKLNEREFVPFNLEEFNELIDKAEKDSLMNKVKSADDLKKEIKTWS
jgi:flagellar biosynthesis/type III secretory pathway chaperone